MCAGKTSLSSLNLGSETDDKLSGMVWYGKPSGILDQSWIDQWQIQSLVVS